MILGIDSENSFLRELKTNYSNIFPETHMIHYNKRRENLANKITLLIERPRDDLTIQEDYFIVDSMPVLACKMSRELRTKVSREYYESYCDKGYSAVNKQYYIGYKLHLADSYNGVYKN